MCTLGLFHSNWKPVRNTWKDSLLPSRLLHWAPNVFPHKKKKYSDTWGTCEFNLLILACIYRFGCSLHCSSENGGIGFPLCITAEEWLLLKVSEHVPICSLCIMYPQLVTFIFARFPLELCSGYMLAFS